MNVHFEFSQIIYDENLMKQNRKIKLEYLKAYEIFLYFFYLNRKDFVSNPQSPNPPVFDF